MRLHFVQTVVMLAWVGIAVSAWPDAAAPAGYPYARETANPTPLDRYVAKPDANYKWELVRTDKEDGLTSYTIDLTSQQWRTAAEVDRPIWKHWLCISVPDKVEHETALLYIDGGNNARGEKPRAADDRMKQIARQTHAVATSVYMIPNQPLVFSDAFGWGRSEDALIAYTWDKFLRTGDDEWPARLPMTKAVVRAMDTIQAFCASDAGGKHTVKDFVVAGGSKRGWATWTTAIVDTRVRAIVPCVIDLLNVIPSFKHHYEVYGHWSAVIGDYASLHVLDWLDTPENAALMKIIDPHNYLDRLKMPKFLMNAGNDQFFVPDSSRFYWNDLQGPKWIRYVPNAGHPLNESAYVSLAAFFHAIVADIPIPNYNFTFEDDGGITVHLEPASNGKVIEPSEVKLWQAYNPEARDFRGSKAEYKATPIAPQSPGVYHANVAKPAKGWISYFIELDFPGPAQNTPFTFSTGIRAMPDTYATTYKAPAVAPKGFLSKK